MSLYELSRIRIILETALLTTPEPLPVNELSKLFNGELGDDTLAGVLAEIEHDWRSRGLELIPAAGGWRFRSRPELQPFLYRFNPEKPGCFSRAALETLAVIAYRQPVTRGDIEQIRGVAASPGILKSLEARGWIAVVGHREAPGRPALYATTPALLADLNLRSLAELPPLHALPIDGDPTPRS